MQEKDAGSYKLIDSLIKLEIVSDVLAPKIRIDGTSLQALHVTKLIFPQETEKRSIDGIASKLKSFGFSSKRHLPVPTKESELTIYCGYEKLQNTLEEKSKSKGL